MAAAIPTIPLSLLNGEVRWLEVTIGSQTLSPRVALLSVPYALVAGNAIGDITPRSVTVNGTTVINSSGQWVGALVVVINTAMIPWCSSS